MAFKLNPITGKFDAIIRSHWKIVSGILRPIVAGINVLIDGNLTVEGILSAAFTFVEGDVVLYISPTGNDTTGDGSVGNPWATPVKLLIEMGRYRTTGTITGNVADGTYTNPNYLVDWLEIPDYAQGDWIITGNNITPTNVIWDGADANPVTGNTLFRHENTNINLSVSGINFKNASQHIVMSGSRIYINNCQFDNYKYAFNISNYCTLESLNGASTLTFNGASLNSTIGIRMLDNCIVKIASNVRMTGNRYDFSGAGFCFLKLTSSVHSTYESVLDATYGTSSFIFSRDSGFEVAMNMTLDGNGSGSIPINLSSRARLYSFGTYTHSIIDYSAGIFWLGVNVYMEEPVSSTWNVSGTTPSTMYADYSVIINSADSFDTSIIWLDLGDIRGYDSRYERIGENYTPNVFDQSAEPSVTDIPAGQMAVWTDTDDSKCYICYNHAGTIKTTELT